MDLELKTGKAYKVKIDEVVYALKAPTFKQTVDLQQKTKAVGEADASSMFVDFIAEMGIPKNVLEQLSIEEILLISKLITETKKN